ncbi:hypothetical protein ACU686_36980 [Yinghuangia aomiensis]
MSRDDVGGGEVRGQRLVGGLPTTGVGAPPPSGGNARLNAYVMVMSFEDKRQISELGSEPGTDKFDNPAGVAAVRAKQGLKGFKAFRARRADREGLEAAGRRQHRRLTRPTR